jgi:hypothetical protein
MSQESEHPGEFVLTVLHNHSITGEWCFPTEAQAVDVVYAGHKGIAAPIIAGWEEYESLNPPHRVREVYASARAYFECELDDADEYQQGRLIAEITQPMTFPEN